MDKYDKFKSLSWDSLVFVIPLVLENKNNIQGWNTPSKGIRSINTKIIK